MRYIAYLDNGQPRSEYFYRLGRPFSIGPPKVIGTGPLTFTTETPLPPGLEINVQTGEICGVPDLGDEDEDEEGSPHDFLHTKVTVRAENLQASTTCEVVFRPLCVVSVLAVDLFSKEAVGEAKARLTSLAGPEHQRARPPPFRSASMRQASTLSQDLAEM